MKRILTILVMILLAAGFSFEGLAADAFDASAAGKYIVSRETVEEKAIEQNDFEVQLFLFTRSLKSAASEFLNRELGINNIHGQPLPGVLITLLLGAAFGLIRRKRGSRHTPQDEQNAATDLLISARLFRMNILFSNPPETIHTISPGPDLFCLRE